MPAQLITISASIVPCSSPFVQDTPETRPSLVWTFVTLVCSEMTAPRWRAPLASAMAMLAGSHWPSSGRATAPTTSETLRCGYISLTSRGEISRTSTSNARATVAWR